MPLWNACQDNAHEYCNFQHYVYNPKTGEMRVSRCACPCHEENVVADAYYIERRRPEDYIFDVDSYDHGY